MDSGLNVTNEQKEACAVAVMRAVLEDYSQMHDVPFDVAIGQFAGTRCYQALFDPDTRLWAEGPDYIRSLFEEALST